MVTDDKVEKSRVSIYLNLLEQWKLACCILSGKYPRDKRVRCIERALMVFFVVIRFFSLSNFHVCFKSDRAKAIFIDVYVLIKMAVLLLMLVYYSTLSTKWFLVVVVIWYILIDTFNYVLCVLFVDMHEKKWLPMSYSGSAIMLFINYLQLIIGFAVLYLCYECIGYSECGNPITKSTEAFYYSTVTITTLGYGDMTPILPKGMILASAETLMGIMLLVLVLNAILGGGWITNDRRKVVNG